MYKFNILEIVFKIVTILYDICGNPMHNPMTFPVALLNDFGQDL